VVSDRSKLGGSSIATGTIVKASWFLGLDR
jgi:hypothetical protein